MRQVALALADGANIAKRNLIKIKRVPEILIWTLMSPIMFVLLFAYVFGSSIDIRGTSYREYLIAGVFAQTVIFGYLILLVFAYAFSWIMAFVGLKVASVEVVNNASFMVIFPLTFIANTFVESSNLPGVLQTIAEWNPVSTVTQ